MKRKVEIWQQPEKVLPVFLAELSFEIRTPLTAILCYTDILLAGQGRRSLTANQAVCLAHIHETTKSLRDIFQYYFHNRTFDRGRIDIHTRLMRILGFADILLNGKIEPLKEEPAELVTRIPEYARKLQNTIEYLFDMDDIASDQLFLSIEPEVDVKVLIEQILADEVQLKILDTIPKIWADKRRVKQVLECLVGVATSLFYDDKKTDFDLSSDGRLINGRIIATGEVPEYFYDYPSPSLFYSWSVIKAHVGRMQVELNEQELEIRFALPIYQINAFSNSAK